MLYYLLSICFFLAFIAAMLKMVRYIADYRRFGKFFYLVGIPANIALATALDSDRTGHACTERRRS